MTLDTAGKRKKDDINSQEIAASSTLVADDPLCCCEYINDNGDKSHILAFCCDCETLDDSFEKLIQRQPQPQGRFNEIRAVFSDRFRIPWLNGARRIELDVILPPLVLPCFLVLGTYGPVWTGISFVLILVWIHIVRKLILFKIKRTKFYCSFTLTSFLTSYLVFELKVTSFLEITKFEYVTNISLLCLTLGLMYETRLKGREDKNLIHEKLPPYYFCRTCQYIVDGRDHHCVWLNCCIGRNNKPWFLTAIFIGGCWIFHTVSLSLTTVCYSRYLFNRFLLVPYSCPDAYTKFDYSVCFVTAIYGIIVLILLIIILIHQSRLVWRGVSYLDWKYANKAASQSKATGGASFIPRDSNGKS